MVMRGCPDFHNKTVFWIFEGDSSEGKGRARRCCRSVAHVSTGGLSSSCARDRRGGTIGEKEDFAVPGREASGLVGEPLGWHSAASKAVSACIR